MSTLDPRIPEDAYLEYIDTKWLVLPEYGVIVGSANREIGSVNPKNGYVYVSIVIQGLKPKLLKRANVIWREVHNQWPPILLDHEDQNRSNDRISNLKLMTQAENVKMSYVRRGVKEAQNFAP